MESTKEMIKFVLLLFCSLFLTINAQSQTHEIDSLKIALKRHKGKDTIRVDLFNNLAYHYLQADLKKSKIYLGKAEDLSNSLNYVKGKGKVFYLKGIHESVKSNYVTSLNYFNESLRYYESISDQNGMASIYSAYGITYWKQSRYDEAISNYKKASVIYEKTGIKPGHISVLINTANVYIQMGRYNAAISMFKKSLKLSKSINDELGVSQVHSNLGVIYTEQGNYPLALEYYNKCLDYNEKTGDTLGMASTFNNLALIYNSMGKYNKALVYLEQSLKLSKLKGLRSLLSKVNHGIGNAYKSKKEYVKALKYFQISLEKSENIQDLESVSHCFVSIGNIYFLLEKPMLARDNFIKAKNLSEKIKSKYVLSHSLIRIAETYVFEKRYDKALPFVQKGKRIAEELELLKPQRKASELLSEIYRKTGDYKKALASFQNFKILNDSLFNKKNIEKMTQLEYEYKYRKELAEASSREMVLSKTVKSTTQDLEKSQRNSFVAIITILLISIVSAGIMFFLKLRNEKSKTQNIIVEQKLLRSQMTPHFIFNSLSVLQGMILNKESKASITYLSKFSKLLHTTLDNSRHKIVSLTDELIAVESYLALQNLDTNPQFKCHLMVHGDIDRDGFLIPPMLIQPFIENAIEHAFRDPLESKEVNVNLKFEDDKLICTIEDNGIGIDAVRKQDNKKKKKNSLATTITEERLRLLSRDFKMKGFLNIKDRAEFDQQGTLVTLEIPYKIKLV